MKSEITVFVAVILIMVLSASVSTVVSSADAEEGKTVSLDTQDTDIRELLSGLAKANGINMVIGDSVKGKVTMSLSGVSPMEAIDLILVSSGFAMEKVGNSIIAGTAEEVRKLLPISSNIVTLKYASASELSRSLSGAMPSGVQIQADPRTNSMIITGPVSGVEKLEQII